MPPRITRSRAKKNELTNAYKNFTSDNIQYYFGHGQDICENKKLKIEIVPKDCAQIATVQCGETSFGSIQTEQSKIFSLSEANIRNLLTTGKFDAMKPFFREGLSVHTEGKNQVDNVFFPAGSWCSLSEEDPDCSDSHQAQINGLYNLSTIQDKVQLWKQFETSWTQNPREMTLWGYQYSLQPTLDMATSAQDAFIVSRDYKGVYPTRLEVDQYLADFFYRNVSELMTRFPGIHIMPLCREILGDCDEATVQERQKESPLK